MNLIQTRGSRHWRENFKPKDVLNITLENATKNADVLGHYANATNTNDEQSPFYLHTYNIPDARNNDYTVFFGQSGFVRWTKSGEVYCCDAGDRLSGVGFVIKPHQYLKVEFDIKFETRYGTSVNHFVRPTMFDVGESYATRWQGKCYMDNDRQHGTNYFNSYICYQSKPSSVSDAQVHIINDNNWHHIEDIVEMRSAKIDCFSLATTHVKAYFKNFVFTYIDD